MNRAELKQAIIESEMPASELAYLVDQLTECPHMTDRGCDLIDICNCDHVEEPDI